ncbi:CDP-glycerol glycerophosphotransferase family protein [Burkholderia lata]|uniref:CDP-Glycerol:Poly(Glycerophosphate) glycerophosphotransferase n=1 Tax=Burkholderia lata (strain ATCC 17760 / DSM 23089 / LMG 22485 / NCIMB 9086 / R18194 / 383) TaxID=482957 RepID=A0A6P2M403_BURL3|nr:CDP-glycerol glycerophosphotransferase family protein [Burkholderia lata]VWB73856.1 hypothetical protein BLA6863_03484 [Burkholderia lata]
MYSNPVPDLYTLTAKAMRSFISRMVSFTRSFVARATGVSAVLDRQVMYEKQLAEQAEVLQGVAEQVEQAGRGVSLLGDELHSIRCRLDTLGRDSSLSVPLLKQVVDGQNQFGILSELLHLLDDSVRQLDARLESGAAQFDADFQKLCADIRLLDGRIDAVQSTVQLVARRSSFGRRRIRCAFLIHNTAAWDALADVVEGMRNHPRFEVFVYSIDRRFPGAVGYGGESEVSEELDRLGVVHRRLGTERTPDGLGLLRSTEPDLIFRQSPWDFDIPDMFSTRNINFARICYIPYYATVLVERHETHAENSPDFHTDMEFHRSCWRIFCDSEFHKSLFDATATRGDDNVVVSGNPKFDRLLRLGSTHPHWPVGEADRRRGTRIIWAPHHSVTDDWLGFGTFVWTYEAMLEWARQDDGCEFVMKPHPALFDRLKDANLIDDAALAEFMHAWAEMPNTVTIQDSSYAELFAASDCLITDGISFIAEYQLFEKPLIFIDSGRHAAFNEIGAAALDGVHSVTSIDDARAAVEALKRGDLPSKSAQQRAFVTQHLNANRGTSAQFIVEYLAREGQT